MRLKDLLVRLAVAGVVGGSMAATDAVAQASTFVPIFSYRTGPFANSGIPNANGMHDYFTMLNERDGGISGSKLVVEECVSSRISPATLCIPSAHPTPGAPGGLFQMHGVGAACRIAASIWA